jgi:DNA-binding response OmpR family regulator
MNILCLEPDVILARQYQKILTKNNHNVTICLDPQAAIEKIDQHKPDAIIMELQLAPLSGLAFLHELRSYDDFMEIPVYVYSCIPNESFKADVQTWSDLGVIKYFYKATDDINTVISSIKSQ